jgi:hypothetical protein
MSVRRHLGALVLLSCAASFYVRDTQAAQAATTPVPKISTAAFSPRDFSGVWARGGGPRGSTERANQPKTEGPDSEWTSEKLPFTAAGRAVFLTRRPADGPKQVKGDMPLNDPRDTGNPLGLYRALRFTSGSRVMQMGHLNGNVVQLLSLGRVWRIIYVDGRAIPKENLVGPYWYGMSIGRWEGNTLVVTTYALDDRQWLDDWGAPISLDARIEERWRRVAADRLEFTFTVTDPAYYTKPWTSTPATYMLKADIEPDETIYAPVDMADYIEGTLRPASNEAKKP